MGIVIKAGLAVFWMVLIPIAVGFQLTIKKEKQISLMESMMAGYVLLFSIAEFATLIAIFCKGSLTTLAAVYGGISVVLAALGLMKGIKFIRNMKDGKNGWRSFSRPSFYFLAACLLIAAQLVLVSVFAHMDADDGYYVAAATTDFFNNSVMQVSAYTGNLYKALPTRYLLSPFSAYQATISKLCMGLHPAILAHVVLPPIFLAFAYGIQYRLAEMFAGQAEQKKAGKTVKIQDIYLLVLAVLLLFSAYSTHNAGDVQMVRLWQGKAFMAAAFIPMTIYYGFPLLMNKEKSNSWLMLFLVALGGCLPSSMGIILLPVLIMCMAVGGFLWNRDWRRVAMAILCCVPSGIFGVIYVLIK